MIIALPAGFDVNVFLNELISYMALAVVPVGIFYAGVLFVKILRSLK